MVEQDEQINALIELHSGLERQGPGDAEFSLQLLSELPQFSENPVIADLGCGAGAGTLVLAEYFNTKIKALDFSQSFLNTLEEIARQKGLSHLIDIELGDMGTLDWKPATIDLLWSEGAAYVLTFAGALKTWRPLLKKGGIAVVSEIVYFENDIPGNLKNYWQSLYPEMGTEADNAALAENSGYEVLKIKRLPNSAWWKSYYNPLLEKIETMRSSENAAIRSVIAETEEEIEMFRKYSDYYGYSFFILQAI